MISHSDSPEELMTGDSRAARRARRRLRTIAVVPTLFTLGNLFCGFFAIVVASRIAKPDSPTFPIPNSNDPNDPIYNCFLSGILIFLGMVFDALDGQVARLAKSSTKFGAQLDSLCDVITFGVAPGFLLVKLVPVFTFYYPAQIWTIAAVFPACAALRLARFTVETNEEDDHSTFRGLPSPAAAASIACFGILFYTLGSPGEVKEYSDWNMSMIKVLQYTLPFFSLAVSAFMVSRIPYPHLTNRLIRGRKSFAHLIGLFFAIVALTVFHSYIIPLVTFYFVFASPVTYLWRRWRQPQQSTETIF